MTKDIIFDYVTDYINNTLGDSDDFLSELEAYAEENHVPIVTKDTAWLLRSLMTMQKPKKILEIGTAIGYSAILFAKYSGANIITLEKDEETANVAKKNIERAGLSDRIQIIVGDAMENIKHIDDNFDFVFLDANKSHYKDYLPDIMRNLSDGGVIVSDNILYKGMVANDELVTKRQKTIVKKLREYLNILTNHDELLTSIIPIGDGVALSVRKERKNDK